MRRWMLYAVVGLALAAGGLSCREAKRPAKGSADQKQRPARELAPKGSHDESAEEQAADTDKERLFRWRVGPICIDPGHGGRDSGTVGAEGALEKTITLDVARRVRQGLEAKGAAVVLTREDDRFIALEDRAVICNEARAGLFVSIHVNGFYTPDVYGFEVYYLDDGASLEAGRAAEAIRRALSAALETRDRGVRRADFTVLSRTNCPAVLIEVGYLTNPDECERLMFGAYRQAIAGAIVAGIVAFGADETEDSSEEEQ